jgi:YbbR domain-containing protein
MLTRLLENWPYKLAALVIAILLKLYVAGIDDPHTTKQFSVPLTLNRVPDNLVVTDSTPDVTLEISGPQSTLDEVESSSFIASVDLRSAHPGIDQELPIKVTAESTVSPDVAIENQSPHTAVVTTEVKSRVRYYVHASFRRVAPAGYTYGQPVVMPSVATVEGPQSMVNRIARLMIFADDIVTGDDNSPGVLDGIGNIVAVDDQQEPINGLSITPSQAEVRIPVRSEAASKVLIINPVVTGSPAYPAQVTGIDVTPDRITVMGAPDALASTSVAPTAPVDITGATADVTETVSVPPPGSLMTAQPVTVKVTVHIRRPTTAAKPTVLR